MPDVRRVEGRSAMATAGYSGTPLPKKLGIKEGSLLATVHGLDVVVAFYTSRAALAKEWSKLTKAVAPNGTVWVAWPKKSSKMATDITEDVLRELLLPSGWVDNKVCAIDDTWSGLRFALRRELR